MVRFIFKQGHEYEGPCFVYSPRSNFESSDICYKGKSHCGMSRDAFK